MAEARKRKIYPSPPPVKRTALHRLEALYENGKLSAGDFDLFRHALCGSDTELRRDWEKYLKDLWKQFEKIPVNPEAECIDAPFYIWNTGTKLTEIRLWFDTRYSRGFAALSEGR